MAEVVEVRWWDPFRLAVPVFAGRPAFFGKWVMAAAAGCQVVRRHRHLDHAHWRGFVDHSNQMTQLGCSTGDFSYASRARSHIVPRGPLPACSCRIEQTLTPVASTTPSTLISQCVPTGLAFAFL